jgi:hypothetical protein
MASAFLQCQLHRLLVATQSCLRWAPRQPLHEEQVSMCTSFTIKAHVPGLTEAMPAVPAPVLITAAVIRLGP